MFRVKEWNVRNRLDEYYSWSIIAAAAAAAAVAHRLPEV